MCGKALWTNYALWKFFQSPLNLGPNQRNLNFFQIFFLFHTKKNKLILQGPRVFRKYDKITHSSWQIYVEIYPEEVEQNCLYKVCKKNTYGIHREIVLFGFPSNITSKSLKMSEQLMESSIKHVTFEEPDSKIIIFEKRKTSDPCKI